MEVHVSFDFVRSIFRFISKCFDFALIRFLFLTLLFLLSQRHTLLFFFIGDREGRANLSR